jgi:RNA ligase
MLKYKFAAYVDLHRIIFGMNERTVWEKMVAGETLEQIIEGLPDEIHNFVTETYSQLFGQFSEIWVTAEKDFERAPRGVDRKTFAEYAKTQKHPALLFSFLDGKDISPQIWKMIYPKVVA